MNQDGNGSYQCDEFDGHRPTSSERVASQINHWCRGACIGAERAKLNCVLSSKKKRIFDLLPDMLRSVQREVKRSSQMCIVTGGEHIVYRQCMYL